MTFYEMICFAKVYNAAFGLADKRTVTNQEIDVVIELLKKLADGRSDWSQEQKDIYKAIADYAKKQIEGAQHA